MTPSYALLTGYQASWTKLNAQETAPASACYLYLTVDTSYSLPAGATWSIGSVDAGVYEVITSPDGQVTTATPGSTTIGGATGTTTQTTTSTADSSTFEQTRNGFHYRASDGSELYVLVVNGSVWAQGTVGLWGFILSAGLGFASIKAALSSGPSAELKTDTTGAYVYVADATNTHWSKLTPTELYVNNTKRF